MCLITLISTLGCKEKSSENKQHRAVIYAGGLKFSDARLELSYKNGQQPTKPILKNRAFLLKDVEVYSAIMMSSTPHILLEKAETKDQRLQGTAELELKDLGVDKNHCNI